MVFKKWSRGASGQIFGPNSTQNDIYRKLGTTLRGVAKGTSYLIFRVKCDRPDEWWAGSGKSHTMMGDDSRPGIIRRFLEDIFLWTKAQISCSFKGPQKDELFSGEKYDPKKSYRVIKSAKEAKDLFQ